jgi:hypothetical protein
MRSEIRGGASKSFRHFASLNAGYVPLSLSSFHGSTSSAFAMRAMLSMDTLRSARSTELRYVRLKALVAQFGDGAYSEARRRAITALACKSGDPHWSKVRREIGRRIGHTYLDTATRYLEK